MAILIFRLVHVTSTLHFCSARLAMSLICRNKLRTTLDFSSQSVTWLKIWLVTTSMTKISNSAKHLPNLKVSNVYNFKTWTENYNCELFDLNLLKYHVYMHFLRTFAPSWNRKWHLVSNASIILSCLNVIEKMTQAVEIAAT